MESLQELKIEINNYCPLDCIHCSTDTGPYCTDLFPEPRFLERIQEAAKLGCKTVSLSGGEPSCNANIFYYVKKISDQGMNAELYTCGIGWAHQYFSDFYWLRLRDLGLKRVIFSLYADDFVIHEQITRTPASFLLTLASILSAVRQELNVEIHFTVMRNNFKQLPELAKRAVNLGVKKISVLRFVPQGRGEKYKNDLGLNSGEYKEFMELVVPAARKYLEIRLGSPFNCFKTDNFVPCTVGKRALIDVKNNIYPCDAFKQRKEFLFSGTLKGALDFFKSFNNLNVSDEVCKACPKFKDCQGGCRAQWGFKEQYGVVGYDPDCPRRGI